MSHTSTFLFMRTSLMLLKEYFEQKDTICMMMQLIMLFFASSTIQNIGHFTY